MKQLLFLLLFPCLALAQYPNNGNQKITLGEQTTADGLIWRGVAADTTLTAKSDTAAYFVLDTANINLYTYKASATGRKWRQLGADTASIAYVNTYGTQTVNGAKTFTNETHVNNNLRVNSKTLFVDATLNRVAIGHDTTNSSFYKLDIRDTNPLNFSALYTGTSTTGTTSLAIQTQSNNAFLNGRYITVTQNASTHTGTLYGDSRASMALIEAYLPSVIMIGTSASAPIKFATNGTVRQIIGATGVITFSSLIGSGIRTVNAAADGSLSASSSILIEENVENINYGLSDVLKLKPVIFNYIDKEKWGEGKDLGFIAEDVMNVIPEATGVMNNSDIYFDLQKLIPVLTKAIQEQQAQIEALKQRLLILENK